MSKNVNELIQKVLSSQTSLKQDVEMYSYVNEKISIKMIEVFKKDFYMWIEKLIKREPIPKSIRGINFGLYETGEGFGMYISGAIEVDETDDDWPCANDYWPKGRYLKTNILKNIKSWEVALMITIIVVKDYFNRNYKSFLEKTGLRTILVTVGFDDGDLYAVYNGLRD